MEVIITTHILKIKFIWKRIAKKKKKWKKPRKHTHFRRWVAKLSREGSNVILGLHVGVAAAGSGRRERRRGGSENLLENSHDEKHGDKNGGCHKPKRHRVNRVVKVGPVIVSLNVEWSATRRRRPTAPSVFLDAHWWFRGGWMWWRRQLWQFGKTGKAFPGFFLAALSCH